MIDVAVEDEVSGIRDFNIDGCWNAEVLPAGESRDIDFSGFRENACSLDESRTGYYKVNVPG